MLRTALFNSRGVSLIELMLSIVILLIVSLALMQTALLGINVNLNNQLRDEAVNIVDMRIDQLRALPFTETYTHPELASNATETIISRTFRSFSIDYTPNRTVTNINAASKQVTLAVTWTYKGKTYSHGVATILRRE